MNVGPFSVLIIVLPLVFAARFIKRSPVTVLKIVAIAGYLALCGLSIEAANMAPVVLFLGWYYRHGDEGS